MEKILIFAGTSEGRMLAEHLERYSCQVHISVATEYGEEVLTKGKNQVIHKGRLEEREIEELLQEEWRAVIDATHPYAVVVSKNIKQACKNVGKEYLRLLREEKEENIGCDCVYVDSKEAAAEYLNSVDGNILLTTGSKELSDYVNLIWKKERIYARILPDGETVDICKKKGLTGKQIICMQGPFCAELNAAMLKQVQAKYLVTKDTGEAGGFPQKMKGVKMAGATAIVIRKPVEEGYSMSELLDYLGVPPIEQLQKKVTLLGIGMGNPEGMTMAAYSACSQADVILGAARMVQSLERFGKPMKAIYEPKEIIEYLKGNAYKNVVVAFSGDVGFYSGATKLIEALQEEGIETELICGVSSVVYAASRLKMPWQDMKLVSVHGRKQNVIGAVRSHKKVFALVGGKDGVCNLARLLIEYGMETVTMHVGCQLSYPEEMIFTGIPNQFIDFDRDGLAVVVVENPQGDNVVVTHGIEDESFIRGEAPMTKEEIRSISISKLSLRKNALVYDIGAGTGSIGIECALQIPEGKVYAIEKKEGALKLLEQNKRKHGVANLEIVPGTAPEALKNLPTPTHAFIGGSSGNMREILECLYSKNPEIRIVINAIALETVAEVMNIVNEKKYAFTDIVQVTIGKTKQLGNYHMMNGQNPVYIFTLQKKQEEVWE